MHVNDYFNELKDFKKLLINALFFKNIEGGVTNRKGKGDLYR